MGKGSVARFWPKGLRTIGEMIDAGALVRFACERCGTIFDVDLHAISVIRGAAYSLIDVRTQCKITGCRGPGHFLAKLPADEHLRKLQSDLPPSAGPNIGSSAPAGVDPMAWFRADWRGKQALMREAASAHQNATPPAAPGTPERP